MIIKKKGRQFLVIWRGLMGDVVVNDARFGRVGEANSWRVKHLFAGSGRLQSNGVALD
jgi:hypothetical protein